MALGTDKVWHRYSVTFSLGHDIFAPLRVVLDVDNCCGHGLQDVLTLTHVLPWWCGADSAQKDCWFIRGNKRSSLSSTAARRSTRSAASPPRSG